MNPIILKLSVEEVGELITSLKLLLTIIRNIKCLFHCLCGHFNESTCFKIHKLINILNEKFTHQIIMLTIF